MHKGTNREPLERQMCPKGDGGSPSGLSPYGRNEDNAGRLGEGGAGNRPSRRPGKQDGFVGAQDVVHGKRRRAGESRSGYEWRPAPSWALMAALGGAVYVRPQPERRRGERVGPRPHPTWPSCLR